MRLPFMKKYNIEEFEFSQSYLFFWDKVRWYRSQPASAACAIGLSIATEFLLGWTVLIQMENVHDEKHQKFLKYIF